MKQKSKHLNIDRMIEQAKMKKVGQKQVIRIYDFAYLPKQ